MITLPIKPRADRVSARTYDQVLDKIRRHWLEADATANTRRRASILTVLADLEGQAEMLAGSVLGPDAQRTHQVHRQILSLVAFAERVHAEACWLRAADLRDGEVIVRDDRLRPLYKANHHGATTVLLYGYRGQVYEEELPGHAWVQTAFVSIDIGILVQQAGVTDQGEIELWEKLAHTADHAERAEVVRELAALLSLQDRWGDDGIALLAEYAASVEMIGHGELIDLAEIDRDAAALHTSTRAAIAWVLILIVLALVQDPGWPFVTLALSGFALLAAMRTGAVPFVPGARKGWSK